MEVEFFLELNIYTYRMLRKNKITAVPIEPTSAEEAQSGEVTSDVKTDAEQMTDAIKEASVDEQPVATAEPAKAKAKPKRVTVKKIVASEPEVTTEANLNEVTAEVTLPKEAEAKTDAKVDCPDCGKKMSAKTLKYSHAPNCVAKKQKTTDEPVNREESPVRNITEEMIEHEVQRRMKSRRSERAARREDMTSKSIQNAF